MARRRAAAFFFILTAQCKRANEKTQRKRTQPRRTATRSTRPILIAMPRFICSLLSADDRCCCCPKFPSLLLVIFLCLAISKSNDAVIRQKSAQCERISILCSYVAGSVRHTVGSNAHSRRIPWELIVGTAISDRAAAGSLKLARQNHESRNQFPRNPRLWSPDGNPSLLCGQNQSLEE